MGIEDNMVGGIIIAGNPPNSDSYTIIAKVRKGYWADSQKRMLGMDPIKRISVLIDIMNYSDRVLFPERNLLTTPEIKHTFNSANIRYEDIKDKYGESTVIVNKSLVGLILPLSRGESQQSDRDQ